MPNLAVLGQIVYA